jgi:Leucine-rich repeat (LRR) protein
MLPSATPALQYLEVLQLGTAGNQEFPASVARALKRLTSLNLSGNKFARLPAALSIITTLQDINMIANRELQLMDSDLDTLTALSRLRILSLGRNFLKHSPGNLEANVAVLIAIGRRLPQLELPGIA